jgi:hypothetical protein
MYNSHVVSLSLSLLRESRDIILDELPSKKKKTKRERERNNMAIIHVIDPLPSR